MGYWRKSSAIFALIVLSRLAPPQEVIREAPRRAEREVERQRAERFPDGHIPLRPGDVFVPNRHQTEAERLQRQRATLQSMETSASAGNWTEVWQQSEGLSFHSNEAESLRLKAARNILADATQARARGDWKEVRNALEPLNQSAPASLNREPSEGGAVGIWDPEPTLLSGATGKGLIELDVKSSLKSTLFSAHALYGHASAQLAERTLRSGNAVGAVPLFREAFVSAPNEATPIAAALYKRALQDTADGSYAKRDWQPALEACDEIQKQRYFSLTLPEKEQISLIRSRSQNWSQATSLPASTLVVDHITTEAHASYFHVFGAGGAVDLLVKAGTVGELLQQPDFRPARDRISRGSDLLLTPSVTRMPDGQKSLREGFPDTTVWSDPYISEATESLAALQHAKLKPADFDLAILLPKNAEQQAAMHLNWNEDQRDHAWQSVEYLKSNAQDVSVVTQSANRTGLLGWVTDSITTTDSKKDVIHSLENSKGVLILFGHGDREGVYTPEGQKLTVADVRGLDLHQNHPIVLLLSCEGNARGASDASSSLAQELKKSGATAVWSYGQKVDAREASSAAVKFLENIRSGKTPLESFRSLSRDRAVRAGPEVHLKVEPQTSVDAWPSRS